MQGLDSIEEMWKAWPNMIKGKALYQSVRMMVRERDRENDGKKRYIILYKENIQQ